MQLDATMHEWLVTYGGVGLPLPLQNYFGSSLKFTETSRGRFGQNIMHSGITNIYSTLTKNIVFA